MLPKLVCIFAAVSMTTAASLLLIGSTVPKQVEAKRVPVAMVVPHHDIVSAQREQLFQEVKKQGAAPKTVILVSPNHFEVGHANVQTTDKTWETSVGSLVPNTSVIHAISGAVEPDGFAGEHGIKLILPDIISTFPGAQIVPIMLKFATSPEEIAALLTSLQASCNDCLLVASVDFSHYQPAILANLHDTVSRRILTNLDQSSVYEKAEVDSPPSLALMMGWAEIHSARQFTEWKHTNSGVLLHDPEIETTTHVFGWYSAGREIAATKNVTFGIGEAGLGDYSQFGNRVLWGTDASMITAPSNLDGEKLKRVLGVTSVESLDGSEIKTTTYQGEGDTMSLLTAGAKATVEAVESVITAQTGTYKVVVVREASEEALARWVSAGADLIVVRSGTASIDKKGLGVVVHGTNSVVAGTFSGYGLDMFLVPTVEVSGKLQVARGVTRKEYLHTAYSAEAQAVTETAEGSLLHFSLR